MLSLSGHKTDVQQDNVSTILDTCSFYFLGNVFMIVCKLLLTTILRAHVKVLAKKRAQVKEYLVLNCKLFLIFLIEK